MTENQLIMLYNHYVRRLSDNMDNAQYAMILCI